jgi:REP element-mobilizing transposase RayT
MVLWEAKEKFAFRLQNFCVMPTHIHLLIIPGDGGDLTQIMRWLKTESSKRWNFIHGSTGHVWGERFFSRVVNGDYYTVMAYIDRNPINAGLALCVGDWQESGAYHIREGIIGLVDYSEFGRLIYTYQYQLYLPKW